MERWEIITTILTVLFGGTSIFQFFFYKYEKRKKEAEVAAMELENRGKSQELDQNKAEYIQERVNKLQEDYLKMFELVQTKCNEVADLKVQITYLKGLRCYNTTCEIRIRKKEDVNC